MSSLKSEFIAFCPLQEQRVQMRVSAPQRTPAGAGSQALVLHS